MFRPLCVAAPLAKKSASMYGMRPPPYMMTDPISAHEIIYASTDKLVQVQRMFRFFEHTVECNEVGVWYESLQTGWRALLQPCEHD